MRRITCLPPSAADSSHALLPSLSLSTSPPIAFIPPSPFYPLLTSLYLPQDEYTVEESGSQEQQQEVDHAAKKMVDRARFDLKMLLEQPLTGPKRGPGGGVKEGRKTGSKAGGKGVVVDNGSRKRGFVVFAK
jgi:hypothetical protein